MDSGGLEAKYIRECHAALIDYIARQKYSLWLAAGAATIAFASVVSVGLIAMAVSYLPDWLHWLPESGDPISTADRKKFRAANLVLLVATLAGGVSIFKYIGGFWSSLAEYLGQRAVMGSFDENDTVEKQVVRVRHRIERAVRQGSIGPGRPFDPATFLRSEFVRTRRVWLVVTIAVMLIGIGLHYRAASS